MATPSSPDILSEAGLLEGHSIAFGPEQLKLDPLNVGPLPR